MEICIDTTNNPELQKKLDADGGAFLKTFAEKAAALVNEMCDESRLKAYETASKEDPAMVALLSGKHVPNSEELLGRATKEELVQVFGTGYDAGYKAGRKRNRIEDLVVRQVNKQLKHQPKPEEKKDEAKEEEEGEEEGCWSVVMPDKDEPKHRSAVAHVDDNGDEEPKYQSLSA